MAFIVELGKTNHAKRGKYIQKAAVRRHFGGWAAPPRQPPPAKLPFAKTQIPGS